MPKLVSNAEAMHIGLIHEKIAIKSDSLGQVFEQFVKTSPFSKKLGTFSIIRYSSLSLSLPVTKSQPSIKF